MSAALSTLHGTLHGTLHSQHYAHTGGQHLSVMLQVSAALREGRPVEPESFDCVTIFFSDIVGFKTMSTELPPQEACANNVSTYFASLAPPTISQQLLQVMSMLDRLYRAFDAVTSRHNLFKVETIGDSYMVVGNLRCPQPDHAARVAYFAIEAVQTAGSILISESNPDMGHLSIRAGFHSGPVVASVVGTTNPRYCLFGDTVNVASRMGSSSIANRIHITSSAAELILAHAPELRPQLVHRRMQQIKGKGVMRTFWLELFP
ncbi:MAG: TKL DICTY4 kinase, partial [Trebouxia sp. A1-2]